MGTHEVMRAAGAFWCDLHARWECVGRSKRTHDRCHAIAITGKPHCRRHAGKPAARAKAEGLVFSAWSAQAALEDDPPPMVDPSQAVMGMLHMSWLRAHLYARLLRDQVEAEGGTVERDPTKGLIGWRFGAAGAEGRVYRQSEDVRALVQLEAAERDRCVRFAKAAHDMGIADREIALAEAQARGVAVALGTVLEWLALDSARRDQAQELFMQTLRRQVEEAEALPAA